MSEHARWASVLTVRCPDRIGIVSAVASFLSHRGLSIEESDQFHDRSDGAFYMRVAFSGPLSADAVRAEFAAVAEPFGMNWTVQPLGVKPRIVVAVSRQGHCLSDLLHRWKTGWLNAEIAAVVSNHDDWRATCEWHGIPFHKIETGAAKAIGEARILEVLDSTGSELLVLARYMQVLSPEMVSMLTNRCINIHHSFLPSFKGARPYHQAHARGVKIIGATAHYVTQDLDEGPIIEQAVERVSHRNDPDALVEIGRDLECTVLARAVRWHAERRIMLAGQRTVVFR